jgi:tetratricopeptide (TPR) repeat protein
MGDKPDEDERAPAEAAEPAAQPHAQATDQPNPQTSSRVPPVQELLRRIYDWVRANAVISAMIAIASLVIGVIALEIEIRGFELDRGESRDSTAREVATLEGVDRVEQTTTQLSASMETLLAELRLTSDNNSDLDRALRAIAARIDVTQTGRPRDEIIAFLEHAVEELVALQTEYRAFTADDPETRALVDAGYAALLAGDMDEAEARLAEADARQSAALVAAVDRINEQRLATARTKALRARALSADPTRWRQAGVLFAEAAEITRPADARIAAGYQFDAARQFYELGRIFGGLADLVEAVDAYEAALTVRTREAAPVAWAMAQNNLGIVLQVLGQRSGDAAILQRAVDAFEAALTVYTREARPVDWAMSQNNLGIVLQVLGQRSGDEAMLQRAVDAYEAALTVRTREAAPVDWAMTQGNLGNVLQVLGQRSGDEAMLQRAVEAFEAALTVRTREAAPVDWARTQNNLGNVLQVLGRRSGDAAILQRAVDAYEAALTVRTREAAPVAWAMTQNNLGIVLDVLGQRSGDEAMLQRAVEAFEAALTVYTREAAPVAWAMTQGNLGNVLQVLGQRSGDAAILQRAVAAHEASLAMFESVGHTAYADIARRNRDGAQAALDRLRGG